MNPIPRVPKHTVTPRYKGFDDIFPYHHGKPINPGGDSSGAMPNVGFDIPERSVESQHKANNRERHLRHTQQHLQNIEIRHKARQTRIDTRNAEKQSKLNARNTRVLSRIATRNARSADKQHKKNDPNPDGMTGGTIDDSLLPDQKTQKQISDFVKDNPYIIYGGIALLAFMLLRR